MAVDGTCTGARQGRAGQHVQHRSTSVLYATSILLHTTLSSEGWSCGTLVLSSDSAECTQIAINVCSMCVVHAFGRAEC
jgi:hypothetical protein